MNLTPKQIKEIKWTIEWLENSADWAEKSFAEVHIATKTLIFRIKERVEKGELSPEDIEKFLEYNDFPFSMIEGMVERQKKVKNSAFFLRKQLKKAKQFQEKHYEN